MITWLRPIFYLLGVIALVAAGVLWLDRAFDDARFQAGSGSAPARGEAEKQEGPAPIVSGEKPQEAHPSHRPPVVSELELANVPVNNREDAQKVLDSSAVDLGLGENDRGVVVSQTADEGGTQYYQLEQTYKGIPVFGARSVLVIKDDSAPELVGSWALGLDLEVEPSFAPEEALSTALAREQMTEEPVFVIEGNDGLVVFITDVSTHLAWKLVVSYANIARESEYLVVDAHDPQILLRNSVVAH